MSERAQHLPFQHQHCAGAELHPLPTGNLNATFKLIYLLPRVWYYSRAWHFLPTPGPLRSLEYLSLTHINSRARLCCKAVTNPGQQTHHGLQSTGTVFFHCYCCGHLGVEIQQLQPSKVLWVPAQGSGCTAAHSELCPGIKQHTVLAPETVL